MNEAVNSTRVEYLNHIEKQKRSGLSIKKYCEQNNLVDHKFSYYRTYNLKSKRDTKSKNSAFAAVEVKKSKPVPVTTEKPKTSKIDPVWLAQFLNNLLSLK